MLRTLVATITSMLILAGCGGGSDGSRADDGSRARPAAPAPAFRTVDPADIAERVASGAVLLVDVREPDEWDAGHAPEAMHVPLAEVSDRLNEIEREANGRPVAFVCRTGRRSAEAATIAVEAGVEDVHNVAGGMTAWVDAGLPLEPPDGRVA